VLQRRKVAELQEAWRGHVSPSGVPSTCWEVSHSYRVDMYTSTCSLWTVMISAWGHGGR
jgi:hypothetical protein